MHSVSCCVWSVMMTLTVVFCLFPQFALGHLGSAIRAGAGTFTKFALGDHIILCTITNLEGKHPMLNHVRVSREPQPRLGYRDEFDSRPSLLQTGQIKSPSYQHKVLQFHSNGQTSSGQDYYPTKLIVNEYPSIKSLPVYPVPSKYGKAGTRYIVKSTSTGSFNPDNEEEDSSDGNDSWETYGNKWEPNLLPEPEDPTFTPYIGARALTNIPKFFEHLRENLQAIYDQKHGTSTATGDAEVVGSSTPGDGEDVDKYSGTEDMERIATPTRRGYPSVSEPTVAQVQAQAQVVAEDRGEGDLTNRDSRSASRSFILANRFLNQKPSDNSEYDDYRAPDEKTRELLRFLGHGKPEYPRANKYNPGWLFTNLGLGKRSHSRFTP